MRNFSFKGAFIVIVGTFGMSLFIWNTSNYMIPENRRNWYEERSYLQQTPKIMRMGLFTKLKSVVKTSVGIKHIPESVGVQHIPKIIHQHWATYQIPDGIKREWLQSWLKLNPDWEYWFWSEDDVRCFLSRHYPWFLNSYNSYSSGANNGGLFRGDAMRYFILYHFGGLYADLDAVCLKSLDSLLPKTCVIPTETPIHTAINFNTLPNLLNAVMMCSPNHGYMKAIMHELPKRVNLSVLAATGPLMITDVWNKYKETSTNLKSVDIVDYKVFNPTYDKKMEPFVRSICEKNFALLNPTQKEVCLVQIQRNFTNGPFDESFTDHLWVHMSLSSKWAKMKVIHIRDVIQSAITYQDRFGKCSNDAS